MGLKTSKQLKAESAKRRAKSELEDIYDMFDETIEHVKSTKIFKSELKRSKSDNQKDALKSSKIRNLDSVLDQLLESFKLKQKYSWGRDIYSLFKTHFKRSFQEMWPINKQQFYKLVLSNCNFQTLDLRQELKQIAQGMELYQANPNVRRMSYERFFYEVGAAKIEQKLPSSFVGQDILPWQQSISHPTEKQQVYNMNAINETIIMFDNDKKNQIENISQVQIQESDFLPLFVHTDTLKKSRISALQSSQVKKYSIYEEKRILSTSIISPQTVFYQRLTKQNKAQIRDLVKFYRQFSNTLQQMFFSSTSIVSAPYKHFIYCIEEKMKRKNIKNKYSKNSGNLTGSAHQRKKNRLLISQDQESRNYRKIREFNNNALLTQIKDFAQAYTDFVWMFLDLCQIGESKLGKLLNIYTLYGIVIKSVWKFVDWISQRGFQYEEYKVEEFYKDKPTINNTKIPIQQKQKLIKTLKTLIGERNPQKYLKKIVIFYREASKICECADDLLNIYEELVVGLIKDGLTRELGLFKMPQIIEKLLKLDQSMSNAGEISYSWTSWCILIQILKKGIQGIEYNKNEQQISRIQTQPDYEQVIIEG